MRTIKRNSIVILLLVAFLGLAFVSTPLPSYAANSNITISGLSAPTELEKGKGYVIRGTVKSANPIKSITVGFCNASGYWIKGKYWTARPYTTTYDIHNLDSQVKFDELSPGTYYLRVSVTDNQNYSKAVVHKKFTVAKPSAMSISGLKAPTSLKKGGFFTIGGKVTSTYPIKSITAGFCDSNGRWIKGKYWTARPNTRTYDIKGLDSQVAFNTLGNGTYYFRVVGTDTKNYSKAVVHKKFTVGTTTGTTSKTTTTKASVSTAKKDTTGITITKLVAPSVLAKGKSFSTSGLVKSTHKIKSITVGFCDSSGRWIKGQYYTARPFTTTYNIKALDHNLQFNKLNPGTYYLRVSVTNVKNQSKAVVHKKFTVAKPSNITISGVSAPTSIRAGDSFVIGGTVKSTNPVKSITVGFCNASGYWIEGKYVTARPHKTSYNIHALDSKVEFNKLSAGTYYLRVVATDSAGYSKAVVHKKFTVQKTNWVAKATENLAGLNVNPNGRVLPYPAGVISAIGPQPYSGPCGIYSMAYCRAILDKGFGLNGYASYDARIRAQYGLGSSYAYWQMAGGSMQYFSSSKNLHRAAVNQINKGRPCIINCYNQNPACPDNHFVVVIGYLKGTTAANLNINSFIILDPATGTKRYMKDCYYYVPADQDSRAPYPPELITF